MDTFGHLLKRRPILRFLKRKNLREVTLQGFFVPRARGIVLLYYYILDIIFYFPAPSVYAEYTLRIYKKTKEKSPAVWSNI